VKKPYGYLIALLLPALMITENVIQWALAVIVGGHSLAGGFHDAFKYFSVFGYLFFTAFRLVPYVCLWKILIFLSKTNFRDYIPFVFAGGLIGIVVIIIRGLWDVQRPLYTGGHVSSTTAVAFLFIPIYAIPAGGILQPDFALTNEAATTKAFADAGIKIPSTWKVEGFEPEDSIQFAVPATPEDEQTLADFIQIFFTKMRKVSPSDELKFQK